MKRFNKLISFFIMQRDYNDYKFDTCSVTIYFSLIRVLKSKKKKLALTLLYFLSWMNNIIG